MSGAVHLYLIAWASPREDFPFNTNSKQTSSEAQKSSVAPIIEIGLLLHRQMPSMEETRCYVGALPQELMEAIIGSRKPELRQHYDHVDGHAQQRQWP